MKLGTSIRTGIGAKTGGGAFREFVDRSAWPATYSKRRACSAICGELPGHYGEPDG